MTTAFARQGQHRQIWPDPMPLPARGASGRDVHFLELLAAYRASGGLATGHEIAVRRPLTGPSELARAIASRELISLDWSGQRWLPVFQFERGDLAVWKPVRVLVDELSVVLDDWEIAGWFVEPHPWLSCATPLQIMGSDFARVHDAARALRFACRN